MTEALKSSPQLPAAAVAGNLVLQRELAAGLPNEIQVGDALYHTDLPAGLDVLETPDLHEQRPLVTGIKPTMLDAIPVGKHTIAGTKKDYDEYLELVEMPVERTIEVVATDKGKAVTKESAGEDEVWNIAPDAGRLMADLGYVVDEADGIATIAAYPTPDTVKRAAAQLGVDIKFFPESAYIPGREYVAAYAEGKYPAAMGDAGFYEHDIEDDHLTAMVLGGEPLRTAMAAAASAALEKDDAELDEAAQNLDFLTAELRAVVASHPNIAGEAYGENLGRATFHERAASLGISVETADLILETAQRNGRAFGLDVKELR